MPLSRRVVLSACSPNTAWALGGSPWFTAVAQVAGGLLLLEPAAQGVVGVAAVVAQLLCVALDLAAAHGDESVGSVVVQLLLAVVCLGRGAIAVVVVRAAPEAVYLGHEAPGTIGRSTGRRAKAPEDVAIAAL